MTCEVIDGRRTRHIEGDAIIVDGVGPDYDAGQTTAHLRQMSGA